jgi:predicted HicB family RNase H-like nuclease
MGAPKDNRNAQKAQERASAFLHIRVPPTDKHAWILTARAMDCSLTAWVVETLNREAHVKKEPKEP